MVRSGLRRIAALGLPLLLAGTVALAVATPAQAADLDRVTIEGEGLAEPLTVRPDENPELFGTLTSEVIWMARRSGTAPKPDEETLGPQFVLVVFEEGEAKYRFDVYPLAEGGPRAFRPADQPADRKVRKAWFYARVSLPETLGTAGVPVPGFTALAGGGGGGGTAPDETGRGGPIMGEVISEWRETMLLNGAVLFAVLIGLAGVAWLIRRKV